MPSAARAFTPELVTSLVAGGVVVAPVLLHAGVSSQEVGEAPYPERYRVSAETAELVNAARRAGRRVLAVGTTVTGPWRARPTPPAPCAPPGAGPSWWSRRRGARVVDGLLTGTLGGGGPEPLRPVASPS
jgi:S-adenosylmethionine:tRNA ribosyltransferase-isomerase